MPTPEWYKDAECRGNPDLELFHYERTNRQIKNFYILKTAQSIVICNQCPVKNECLKEGLKPENLEDFDMYGNVWGGLISSERLALLPNIRVIDRRQIKNDEKFRTAVRKLVKEIEREDYQGLPRTKGEARSA